MAKTYQVFTKRPGDAQETITTIEARTPDQARAKASEQLTGRADKTLFKYMSVKLKQQR
jgi:hypothetical protein